MNFTQHGVGAPVVEPFNWILPQHAARPCLLSNECAGVDARCIDSRDQTDVSMRRAPVAALAFSKVASRQAVSQWMFRMQVSSSWIRLDMSQSLRALLWREMRFECLDVAFERVADVEGEESVEGDAGESIAERGRWVHTCMRG